MQGTRTVTLDYIFLIMAFEKCNIVVEFSMVFCPYQLNVKQTSDTGLKFQFVTSSGESIFF